MVTGRTNMLLIFFLTFWGAVGRGGLFLLLPAFLVRTNLPRKLLNSGNPTLTLKA